MSLCVPVGTGDTHVRCEPFHTFSVHVYTTTEDGSQPFIDDISIIDFNPDKPAAIKSMSEIIFEVRSILDADSEAEMFSLLDRFLADSGEYLNNWEPALLLEGSDSPPPALSPQLLAAKRPRISARKPKFTPVAHKPAPHRPRPILILDSPISYSGWTLNSPPCETFESREMGSEMGYLTPPLTSRDSPSKTAAQNDGYRCHGDRLVPSDIMYFLR